ncbi:whiskers protein [Cronobacter phage vB_CsaM_leE]|uniref:Whiskers protein n=3 Tax=Pseudotevenvirus TaxID=2842979 RepID=A0A1X8VC80_9CAUD|nr:fibritin neck whisker [Cronobacter phage vB_CsaM_leB]YP_009831504.1 fibritin neck whisker [Cronobacter phage vB_CsaM_leE]AOG16332.1 fibritin neck whisker protein [Cronobacter phage vB_CsaM_leB]AOG16616.1 whiskers protein [Cronobacter phage vB_CsaM_leN]AON97217.1 whiskers protein [Cronobacter phage vB_CsaM_leE]
MISKLNPLPKIPFVDGVPTDTTQTQINWIVNGETLDGAKTKTTNEGSLNRCGVLVQKNAVQLEANTTTQTSKINEVIDQVNLITENLAAISDDSVIDKLDKVVADVDVLKVDMSAVQATTASNTLKIQDIEKEIGVWDASTDPKHRTIRKDIIFLKDELGAYPGFNEDGDVDPSSTGSGVKYKVMANAQAVSIHEARITKLEDDWVNSDVGHLTDEVTDLRNEMGPKHLATFESVYVRLNGIGGDITGINTELSNINTYIGRTGSGGSGSIDSRMETAETNITTLQTQMNDPVVGVLPRVILLESAVGNSQVPGSIRYDISTMKRSISDLNMIVGETSDDGLRGEMAQVMTDIGTDSQPTSIKGRLLNVENTQRDDHQALVDVTAIVGNTSTGLVAANIAMGKAVYGDATSSDPFLKDGIQKTARDNKTAIGVNTTGSETGIYKLISDLTARVAALEAGGGGNVEQRLDDLEQNKASRQDVADALVPYITEVEADNKYEAKKVPLSFTQNLVGRNDYIEGDDISLSVTVTGGKLPYVYQWKKGTANIGTDSPSVMIQNITTSDSGVYKVVVTDAENTVITSDELDIAVHTVPQFDTNLSDISVVDGDPLTLEVVFSGGKTPYTYVWHKDGSVLTGETGSSIVKSAATSADAGDYYVTVTDAMNSTNDSATATVTVTTRPALAFTTDLPATKSYTTGDNMDLAVVVTGGKTPYTYKWFKDTVEVTGETGASLATVAEAGVYKVEVTDALSTKITSAECTVTVA